VVSFEQDNWSQTKDNRPRTWNLVGGHVQLSRRNGRLDNGRARERPPENDAPALGARIEPGKLTAQSVNDVVLGKFQRILFLEVGSWSIGPLKPGIGEIGITRDIDNDERAFGPR